ncbi:MAG: hypothetical protein DCC58_07100 [Chloroflexi bacterium]|nr:MAG: hypothetical protein DCC58_07100 [Chloroflexota bacterium]
MDGRLIHRRRTSMRRERREPADGTPLDLNPRSVYEVVTRQMLDGLSQDVQAVRGRVDALFFLVIGSILLDLLLRLVGR